LVALIGLVEENRLGADGEAVPALSLEHRAVHGGMQFAQALDVIRGLGRIVKAVVGLGHALVASDHEKPLVVRLAAFAFTFARAAMTLGYLSLQSNPV
jgi:hypothetical protein